MNPVYISAAQLKLFAPNCDYNRIAPALNAAAIKYQINTPRRIRHFLAHISVESAYFSRLTENLNYSAKRLTQVWPSRFPTLSSAAPFANNPEALANKVYGGRLGNNAPGDGYKYRGRGFIQLTGKANYIKAANALDIDLINNPDLAAKPAIAAMIAGYYWHENNLNAIVAKDTEEKIYSSIREHLLFNEEDDLRQGTKAINGGLIGLDERRMELHKAGFIWKD